MVSDTMCPGSPGLQFAIDVYSGVSAQRIFINISTVCTALTVVLISILMLMHASNYTIPREQKLILRIISLPSIYAICNILSVIFYPAAIYLDQIPVITEALALCALFELYVFYLTPGATTNQRDHYFLERRGRFRTKRVKHSNGSLRWFKGSWLLVFQNLPISILLTIIVWIAAVCQCPHGTAAQATKLILQLLSAYFIGVSIAGIFAFERRLKAELKLVGAMPKFLAIKLFVFVSITQTVIFAILQKFTNIGKETPHLNYYDLTIGLPDVLFELEMLLFALIFFWAYSPARYRHAVHDKDSTGQTAPRLPIWRAVVDPLNPVDVFKGTRFAFLVLVKLPFGKRFLGYAAEGAVELSPERKPVVSEAGLGQGSAVQHSPMTV